MVSPQGQVAGVGQVIVLPAIPLEMEGFGEQENEKEKSIVKREDAQGPAGVEDLEVVAVVEGLKEDAGDEEAGEGEEEVDADPTGLAQLTEEVKEAIAGLWV